MKRKERKKERKNEITQKSLRHIYLNSVKASVFIIDMKCVLREVRLYIYIYIYNFLNNLRLR
jgi:hypothetical protein